MSSTKYYALNQKQLYTLKLLYKFRFVTVPLLARYKHTNAYNNLKSLELLRGQGYVDRVYSASYKLHGKAARYYLTKESHDYLRREGLNEQVLHAMYKNKTASEGFVDQHILAMQTCIALRDSYPDIFSIFARNELKDFDYMPEKRPDLYLNRTAEQDNTPSEYLVYIYRDTRFFKDEFTALLEHFDSGDWEAGSGTDYPAILLVCGDVKIEKRLQAHIYKALDNTGIDDLDIRLTTIKALDSSNENTRTVWSSVYEPDKLSAI